MIQYLDVAEVLWDGPDRLQSSSSGFSIVIRITAAARCSITSFAFYSPNLRPVMHSNRSSLVAACTVAALATVLDGAAGANAQVPGAPRHAEPLGGSMRQEIDA